MSKRPKKGTRTRDKGKPASAPQPAKPLAPTAAAPAASLVVALPDKSAASTTNPTADIWGRRNFVLALGALVISALSPGFWLYDSNRKPIPIVAAIEINRVHLWQRGQEGKVKMVPADLSKEALLTVYDRNDGNAPLKHPLIQIVTSPASVTIQTEGMIESKPPMPGTRMFQRSGSMERVPSRIPVSTEFGLTIPQDVSSAELLVRITDGQYWDEARLQIQILR